MALIEIQFREDVFFEILRAQVVRLDVPPELFPELETHVDLTHPVDPIKRAQRIERIEVGQAGFYDPADDMLPPNDGQLLFKISFVLHHTNFIAAHSAGSLQPPATRTIPCVIWIKLSGQPPAAGQTEATIAWSLVRLDVSGQQRPALPGVGDTFPLKLGIDSQNAAWAAGAGVVALRFGTRPSDVLLGPVVNRLGGADWGQFVEGQVFADEVASVLNGAVQDAAKDSSDPVLEIDSLAVGLWSPSPPAAFAAVDITAVDAILGILDVPVRITASTIISTDITLHQIVLRTTVMWFAHDVVTTASGGAIQVVQDKVSEAVLKKLKPPHGQEEVERDEQRVVYKSVRDIVQPKTPLFAADVQQASFDGSGLNATGPVTVYPPPVAFFTLEDQRWDSGSDCQNYSWHTKFHPAAVHIFCPDRCFELKIRSNPLVDPPGFWVPSVGWTGFGPGIQIADIVFEPPFPMKPAGTSSGAYFDTNLGVRYVDLGRVPPEPNPPDEATRVAIIAGTVSECMAISNRWGMGVLNLAWNVDPPDLNLGLGAVREWTIAADGVVDVKQMDAAATGPKGVRLLTSVPVERGALFVQIVTDADEALQVRSAVRTVAAPPRVFQRWIVVWSKVPVESGTVPLALSRGELWVAKDGNVTRIEMPDSQHLGRSGGLPPRMVGASSVELPASIAARLKDGWESRRIAAPRTVSRGRIVAVRHRDEILLGVAGPLIPAMQPLTGKRAT
jgi:hypothetical protein